MPVFVTWLVQIRRPEPTRSRSWLTSSGVASHPTAPSEEEPDRSTRLRGPKVRWSSDLSGLPWNFGPCEPTSRGENRPMFHGPSWVHPSRVPLCFSTIRRPPRCRVALEKEDSSGASSRLAPSPLRRASTLPAGRDRVLGHLPFHLAVAGLPERLGPQPRSQMHHALPARVGEAKNAGERLWITGISGTTVGTLCQRCVRLPEAAPAPTSAKCLNRLLLPTNPPIWPG